MRPSAEAAHVSNTQRNQSCPLTTSQKISPEEILARKVPDVRAYKLGKKRWSYNQCELVLTQQGSTSPSEVTVVEAVHVPDPALHSHISESQASYDMKLSNNQTIHVAVFLVHSSPDAEVTEERDGHEQRVYQWTVISRSACKKGCQGPVLRTLQRFGALGRRSNGPKGTPAEPEAVNKKSKDCRYMYLSIDEAGTHIGAKTFRLIAGVYDKAGQELLGTACCPPIRVLSNNDVPGGAAHIMLSVTIRKEWAGWASSAPCTRLSQSPVAPEPPQSALRRVVSPFQLGACPSLQMNSLTVAPSTDADLQAHMKHAYTAARDPRLLAAAIPSIVATRSHTLPASWNGSGASLPAGDLLTPQLQDGPRQPCDSMGFISSLDTARTPNPSCPPALLHLGHTQLAQRAMSAHDMGVEMASYKGLSTLESGSKSQSWHAASSFVQRSIDVTAGQEYTRAQPRHADSGVLHEHDLVPQYRTGVLLSPIHPFFDPFASPNPSSCVPLQPGSHAQPQEMETHGSHTSFTQQAGPPSFGTSGSTQQQRNRLLATAPRSSSRASKLAVGFDPYARHEVSQDQVGALEPQSSQEGSQKAVHRSLRGSDGEDQAAGSVQEQQLVRRRVVAPGDDVSSSLQEVLVMLSKGQGARLKKLKRKISWQADQLLQEKAKVASIQTELSSTTQELQLLREQVAELQRACQVPVVGLTPAMQPRLFGAQPVPAQENQPDRCQQSLQSQEMIMALMSADAGPSAPPTSLQHLYNSIFRGMPSGHIARSASQSIGMASLKLALVDMNMLIMVSVTTNSNQDIKTRAEMARAADLAATWSGPAAASSNKGIKAPAEHAAS
ncbi:MAG: hypothetical protein FRX49_08770 [Trebouxia sp. A1-2]|nr:MAG: hypothetical protein FRX49_08770 [Trebouxia sp. A1-2]